MMRNYIKQWFAQRFRSGRDEQTPSKAAPQALTQTHQLVPYPGEHVAVFVYQPGPDGDLCFWSITARRWGRPLKA